MLLLKGPSGSPTPSLSGLHLEAAFVQVELLLHVDLGSLVLARRRQLPVLAA